MPLLSLFETRSPFLFNTSIPRFPHQPSDSAQGWDVCHSPGRGRKRVLVGSGAARCGSRQAHAQCELAIALAQLLLLTSASRDTFELAALACLLPLTTKQYSHPDTHINTLIKLTLAPPLPPPNPRPGSRLPVRAFRWKQRPRLERVGAGSAQARLFFAGWGGSDRARRHRSDAPGNGSI